MNYTLNQLEKAFKAVQNPNDWKAPISAAVKGEAVNLVVEAVKHYTATVPTISLNTNSMTYLIESEGYRMGPAGDH